MEYISSLRSEMQRFFDFGGIKRECVEAKIISITIY